MVAMTRVSSVVSSLLIVAGILAVASPQAQAQVTKPFKISGAGVGPVGLPLPDQDPRTHWAAGQATHLGAYCGAGEVETDSAELQPDGTIAGEFGSGSPFVFTGANGDELVCWYGRTDHGASTPGTFVLTILQINADGSMLVEAAWIAEFVPDPDESTGKFAGVKGSWTMYAYSSPFILGSSDPVDYSWDGEGTLTFRH
jgi:hypothetical protein